MNDKTRSTMMSSASPEHYTPEHIITLAAELMGAIDLDPCSNSRVWPNVPAAKHYTAADNGLAHPWPGRVYLNPPYGRKIGQWTEYMRSQYEHGPCSQALALLPARTDTRWMKHLRKYPRCYIHGRLKFIGNSAGAPFPSVLVYLAPAANIDRFYQLTQSMGDVYVLYEQDK